MSDCLVSYIIITRNRFDKCLKVLRNVFSQDWPAKNIVLIDDDSSCPLSEHVERKYPEVTLVKNKKRLGIPESRNVGIQKASGDVLIFIDDDALFIEKYSTAEIVRIFKENPKAGILSLAVLDMGSGDYGRKEIPRKDKKVPDDLSEIAYFTGTGFAIKRDILEKTGIFDGTFFAANEELDLSYRVLKAGYHIYYLKKVKVLHDSTPENTLKWFEPYYTFRNRVIVALRYLPFPYHVLHIIFWTFHSFSKAVYGKKWNEFWRALKDVYPMWKRDPLKRYPMDRNLVKKIKSLSGRILY
ncbi:MAG: glycosyltransferase family 2 protein [Candidatus Aminicenantes bacterium]|nr:glycosyltransferase family 2 protein [Candidatus Aminicenantes bacterium]